MDKTFKKRPRFKDGVERCGTGIFICLSKNQVDALERLAKASGKSLKIYLRDLGEAAIEQIVPAK